MPLFWFGLIKQLLFPVGKLEALCPTSGTIVDLGCGNGFFSRELAWRAPGRRVVGYDWDAARLHTIATSPLPDNLSFHAANIQRAVREAVDADHFLISDVLYLLAPAVQDDILKTCYQRLPSAGTLILKIADRSPHWKFRFESLQETLAVKLLGVSKSGSKRFAIRSADEYRALLRGFGFSVTIHRLDAWRPYPHVALVCTKEAAHA